MKLTAEIEKMEKNPDAYNDADLDDVKVEIKQVEALIKELKDSIRVSTTVFESLHVQVRPAGGGRRINAEPLAKHLFLLFRSQLWTGP